MSSSAIIGALEHMQGKLLDLSSRNRLINFDFNRKTVLRFVDAPLEDVYAKLVDPANKKAIAITGLPEPSRAEYVMHQGKQIRPNEVEWARRHGISVTYDNHLRATGQVRRKLQTLIYATESDQRVRTLRNQARLVLEETGSNMLYLVFGFLEFPDKGNPDRRFAAPLVTVPVTINQILADQRYLYTVAYSGEDIGQNMSLQEKLRQDLGYVLPEFDDDRMTLSMYLDMIEEQISAFDGCRVLNCLALSLITNYTDTLLIRDLTPKAWGGHDGNKLLTHPIVTQLLQGTSADGSVYIPASHAMHVNYAPSEVSSDLEDIPLVFDADSSQLAAIDAVVNHGKSLVISGPPGTGKSQTIANMIAALIRKKKRVLFIADKMAALEVVKRRLEQVDLGHFLLSLHGQRVNKKEVIDSIGRRIELRLRNERQFNQEKQSQEQYRGFLRSYLYDLHRKSNLSPRVSAHELLWDLEQIRIKMNDQGASVDISHDMSLPERTLLDSIEQLKHLQRAFQDLPKYTLDSPLARIVSYIDSQEKLQDYLQRYRHALSLIDQRSASLERLASSLGTSPKSIQAEDYNTVLRALRLLEDIDQRSNLWYDLRHILLAAQDTTEITKAHQKLMNELSAYHEQLTLQCIEIPADAVVEPDLAKELDNVYNLRDRYRIRLEHVSNLQEVSDSLYTRVNALDAGSKSIRNDLEVLGLSFYVSDIYHSKLSAVLEMLSEMPAEHWIYQSNNMLGPLAESAARELIEERTRLDALKAALEVRCYIDLLPDAAELQRLLDMLHRDTLCNKLFSSEWKAARAKVMGLLRYATKSIDVLRQACHDAIIFRQKEQEHVSNPRWDVIGLKPHLSTEQLAKAGEIAHWNRAASIIFESSTYDLEHLLRMPMQQAIGHKRLAGGLRTAIPRQKQLLSELTAISPAIAMMFDQNTFDAAINRLRSIINELGRMYGRFAKVCNPSATFISIEKSLKAYDNVQALRISLANSYSNRLFFGSLYAGADTDMKRLDTACKLAWGIIESGTPRVMLVSVFDENTRNPLSTVINLVEGHSAIATTTSSAIESLRQYVDVRGDQQPSEALQEGWQPVTSQQEYIALLHEITGLQDHLIPLHRYAIIRSKHVDVLLRPLVELMERRQTQDINLESWFMQAVYKNSLKRLETTEHGRFLHNQSIDDDRLRYSTHDKHVIELQAREIANSCIRSAKPPTGKSGSRVDEKTEMQLINYLIPQLRPRVPIRKLLQRAGNAVLEYKPCFMMSPQAVAQYLVPNAVEFDVVIIDEASQVKPEKAIGAVARGRQLVVVGDSKQLPPTSFFEQTADTDDEDQLSIDTSSVLTLSESHIPNHASLMWHYRSQHESLIAFSNQRFYDKRLVVTPSPYRQSANLGIYGVYLANAVYANTMNAMEADHCVELALAFIKKHPEQSLGIVTLNRKQAELIQRVLDNAVVKDRAYAEYLTQWEEEGQPLFVKNLENVQGDERDAIIISTTFGPSEKNGKVLQNFGPIGKTGGERRLNVLFTRAKRSLTVVTSMKPDDISVGPATPLGTRILREYLENILNQDHQREYINDHDEVDNMVKSITHHLRSRGYMCLPNYGTVSSKIDIVIEHPKYKGVLLAAIETDGQNYRSIGSTRDRDRLRTQVMESMGWKGRIIRVWSAYWYQNRQKELHRIVAELDRMLTLPVYDTELANRWTQIGARDATQMPAANVKDSDDAQQQTSATEAAQDITSEDQYDYVDYYDTVRYVDIERPDEILMFQLVKSDKDMIEEGVVSINKPLGRIMYHRKAGDEVALHLAGKKSTRRFMILEVHKKIS